MTILLVDDDRTIRRVVAFALEAEGFSVRAVESGEAALADVEQFTPSGVLLDLGLPAMDGFELARRLRALPATQGAVILAITAREEDGLLARALAAGCDDLLAKPLELTALSRALSARLGAPRDSLGGAQNRGMSLAPMDGCGSPLPCPEQPPARSIVG
ncbi:MAG: chemotaxis protein CheY [Gemmatimonadetes bacterium]|nr:chemotaxis protein CheY [Gemmatimonadota bacterium]